MPDMNPKFHHTLTNLSHSLCLIPRKKTNRTFPYHFRASSNIYKHAHQIITGKIKWHQERQTMTCIFTMFMLQQFFLCFSCMWCDFYFYAPSSRIRDMKIYDVWLEHFHIWNKFYRFNFLQTIHWRHKTRSVEFTWINVVKRQSWSW